MHRKLLILGSSSGFLAVVLGAFASHGLEKVLTLDQLNTFETGVRYQFYHALFAILCGSISALSEKSKNLLFYMLLVGMILFSGSIYGLATNELSSFDFKSIALLTPLGGVFLIFSWLVLLFNVLKMKKK
ncbi:DUF423 domain-containing protein [Mesonia sp. MT50]|uniref:DUF423 domain-containing protein n=1 Tax=Mesonia profundi TaxID=3070998 RepID=A0ABU1A011_9FLAO|nr:DUF423 domain-containing protein [Mesonia profundi]MDQ7916239.1 DUF423 domain-containing protein [Mesonia profundi]